MALNSFGGMDGIILGIPVLSASSGLTFSTTDAMLAIGIYLPVSKTVNKVHFYFTKQTGNGGTPKFRFETSNGTPASNQYPSGSLMSGAADDETTSVSATGWVSKTLGSQVTIPANTMSWLVVSNVAGDVAADNFRLEHTFINPYSSGTMSWGSQQKTMTKTATTWSNYASDGSNARWCIEFTDGTFVGFPFGNVARTSNTYKVYGTNDFKIEFSVPFLFQLCQFQLTTYRAGTPGSFMTFVLKDGSGNTLRTNAHDWAGYPFQAGSAARFGMYPVEDIVLNPHERYSLYISSTGDDGSSSNYWAFLSYTIDGHPTAVYGSSASLLHQTAYTSTDSGSNWTEDTTNKPNLVLHGRSAGDFINHGTISMDSTVRDGSSGYSVKLRSDSEVIDYTYRRRVYMNASKTGYSVKMRRSATTADQPASQTVMLYKNGSQIGSTLTADANSDGTFYTYSLSGLSISAGDVIQVDFNTKLKAAATSSQGYSWFDTEAFS